jgi:hypothetical protein
MQDGCIEANVLPSDTGQFAASQARFNSELKAMQQP